MTTETTTNVDTPKTDLYARITDKIIADLEQGELTWRKPWSAEHLGGNIARPKRWNHDNYTGINTLVLWATAAERGYASPYWMTFKQAQYMKGSIRKGEKGTMVVYADKLTKEEQDKYGNTVVSRIPFLKSYTVFNATQIEGLPPEYYELPPQVVVNPEERDGRLDAFVRNTKADIQTGTMASYNLNADRILMPPFESFYTSLDYYSTLSHELTHWTRHETRLNRDMGRTRFGDEGYAKEELVAELGACFLSADFGLSTLPTLENAAYIQSWLKVLKDDKRFIFTAASFAQRAVEYMYRQQM